jgi:HlyD family secretion protein
MRREANGRYSYALSHAPAETSIARLAEWKWQRYFVERTPHEAQSERGWDERQAQKYRAWEHHFLILRHVLLAGLLVSSVFNSAAAFWPFDGDDEGRMGVVLHGNVDIRQVDVAFEVVGRIEVLAVEEGARVEKDQVLAGLRTDRYRQSVARAEAEVEAQRERLAALEAGTRIEEIRRLQAELEAAKAEAANAAHHFRRLEALRERKLTADEYVDDARSALKVAQARTRAVQRQLELAIAGPRKEDIAAARAQLNALQAALARARIDLGDTTLQAPQAGIIRERLLQVGDIAGPERPVFSLALTNPVWVRTYVPETELARMQPGIPATVYTDSGPERGYPGWVGYVSPTAEFTPKNVETEELRTDLVYQVRIMVCNPEGQLRLGMPATVTIASGARAQSASTRCVKHNAQ